MSGRSGPKAPVPARIFRKWRDVRTAARFIAHIERKLVLTCNAGVGTCTDMKENDAILTIRLPRPLLTELSASTPDVSKKVRALIAQYLKKRAGERAKAPSMDKGDGDRR